MDFLLTQKREEGSSRSPLDEQFLVRLDFDASLLGKGQ